MLAPSTSTVFLVSGCSVIWKPDWKLDFGASGELHAARWHLKDIGSACPVEHVRPIEEARKRLAVPAVADETEAGVRANAACDTAYVAALAAKRELVTIFSHNT